MGSDTTKLSKLWGQTRLFVTYLSFIVSDPITIYDSVTPLR